MSVHCHESSTMKVEEHTIIAITMVYLLPLLSLRLIGLLLVLGLFGRHLVCCDVLD